MKTSEIIAVATVSLFEAVDCLFMVNRPAAPQIFASKPSKALTLALASLYSLFRLIYQKFNWRRMDKFYEYAT